MRDLCSIAHATLIRLHSSDGLEERWRKWPDVGAPMAERGGFCAGVGEEVAEPRVDCLHGAAHGLAALMSFQNAHSLEERRRERPSVGGPVGEPGGLVEDLSDKPQRCSSTVIVALSFIA